MNINYNPPPCHGAVIWNCCLNCLTVWSHGPFLGIIPNIIHWKIEILNDQRMLTNDARVHVTVRVCSLFSVIYHDCINSNGTDDGGNISFTKNYLPCKYRIFTIGCVGSYYWYLWCWFHDSHQCRYLLHHLVCYTTPFGHNLLLCRIVSPDMSLLVDCCYLVIRNCLILLLGIVHIFNSSSTAALTFIISSSFVVRWLYPWNIQLRRRDLVALIEWFLLQRDTSIIISPEGSSHHDMRIDCITLSYLDNLNQMSDLGPSINPHMPMLLETFKDVMTLLLYFNVEFKI